MKQVVIWLIASFGRIIDIQVRLDVLCVITIMPEGDAQPSGSYEII